MTSPQIHVRITEVTVSAIPDGNINHDVFSVQVAWRGGETYAVTRRGRCLSAAGTWDYESIPSERTDEWIAAHRFTYDEAYRRAIDVAPTITTNGFTVEDVLRRSE